MEERGEGGREEQGSKSERREKVRRVSWYESTLEGNLLPKTSYTCDILHNLHHHLAKGECS